MKRKDKPYWRLPKRSDDAILLSFFCMLGLAVFFSFAWGRQTFGHFLAGLVMPASAFLLAALISGRLGREYGVHLLFCHEQWPKQLAVGLGTASLWWQMVLISFLLTDVPNRPKVSAAEYFVGVGLGAVLVGLAVWGLTRPADSPTPRRVWFLIGFLTWTFGELLISLVYGPPDGRLMRAAHACTETLFDLLPRGLGRPSADPLVRPYHDVAWIAVCLSAIFYALSYSFHRTLGRASWWPFSPAWAIVFILHGLVLVYGFLVFTCFRPLPWTIPLVLTGLFGLILLGGIPRYKLSFPGLENWYETPLELPEYCRRLSREPRIPPLGRSLPHLRGKPPEQSLSVPEGKKQPLVIVAVSGGASRSAAWASAILCKLDTTWQAGRFSRHIRLITGASGGMVGAAHFALNLLTEESPTEREKRLATEIRHEVLTPIAFRLAFGDLFQIPSPFRHRGDRGRTLEKAWSQTLRGVFDVPFEKLKADEEAGKIPSLIFSPMLVEDGRQLLISNLDLKAIADHAGTINGREHALLSRSAVELFDLFPEADKRFTVATAVRMSASFPFVSPAVELPTIPPRRVVDAGYYDSYGVGAACAWILAHREWIHQHYSGVALVQIRDEAATAERTMRSPQPSPMTTVLGRGLAGFLSPLDGAAQARLSATSFRNDDQIEMVASALREYGTDFFSTIVLELEAPVSMSWYLTADEQVRIEEEATRVVTESIPGMEAWWRSRTAAMTLAPKVPVVAAVLVEPKPSPEVALGVAPVAGNNVGVEIPSQVPNDGVAQPVDGDAPPAQLGNAG